MEKYYVAKIYASRHDVECNWIMDMSKMYLTMRGANNWALKRFNQIYPGNEDVTAIIEEIYWDKANMVKTFQVSYIHA